MFKFYFNFEYFFHLFLRGAFQVVKLGNGPWEVIRQTASGNSKLVAFFQNNNPGIFVFSAQMCRRADSCRSAADDDYFHFLSF